MQMCRKPSTVQLVKRLTYSNLLGVDVNLKNGRPVFEFDHWHELSVGDFYEAIGIDACTLVEYAGLNPFGGLRSDSIPRAGCPVVGPKLLRKQFHHHHVPKVVLLWPPPLIRPLLHLACGFVKNLRQTLDDLTRNGYSVVSTVAYNVVTTCIVEEVQGPTQARARKSRFISGHAHPGSPYVFGLVLDDQDLDFPEPMPVVGVSRSAKGYCLISVLETMKTYLAEDGLTEEALVKELYGLDDEVSFRNVTVSSENRPRPLHLGTATQIGQSTKMLMYIRDLLLNPPAYAIASTIQTICKHMSNVTCSIPEFTCIPSAKLVKLLELREANHIEFCKIKSVLDEIMHMHRNSELNEILKLLMDPTWVATGLKIDFEALVVEDFVPIISRIKASTAPLGGPKGEILYAREHEAVWFKGKRFVPSVWGGTPGEEQIKQLRPALDSKGRKVGEEWFTTTKVEAALTRYHEAGSMAKAKVLQLLRGLSAELQAKTNVLVFASMLLVIAKALFAHVLVHGIVSVLKNEGTYETIQEVEQLDVSDGMKIVGLSPYWFDAAQGIAVRNTVDMQSLFLLTGPNGGGKSSLLRSICAAALLGICGFMVPAKSALIPHFDSIMLHVKSYDSPADGKSSFQIEMSEIRSIITGATSRSLVLVDEICRGTETAKGTCIAGSIIETLDRIGCLGIISTHLHDIFSLPLTRRNIVHKAMGTEIVDGQTRPTWKLIDGICKESLAFETAQREGIPEKVIKRAEELYLSVYGKDSILERHDKQVEYVDCDINVRGPEKVYDEVTSSGRGGILHSKSALTSQMEILRKKVESAVTTICQEKLLELYNKKYTSELGVVKFVLIAAKEQPPPSTIGASSVYLILRPDKKLYVGETDDLEGRVRAHRSKDGMHNASFLYFLVPGKSMACQLETLIINQLPSRGFQLTNIADGKHRNFGTSSLSLDSTMAGVAETAIDP
ncbi:hypothetical protein RJ640_010540 [Escallonia rubra]|uniref:DNA mismatch repair proteins mutS family domain-containing protein n=1 Tax=Escallonia rubra TaxID=112253 RepID=A0AA88QZQ4_9ASTE|nr:hypothetical protein RJ640_010540 [Escallonia rubra]